MESTETKQKRCLVFEKRVSRKDAATQRKRKKEEKEKFFKVVSFVHPSLICFRTQYGKLFASGAPLREYCSP